MAFNQALSQRRADAVKSYLVHQDIITQRLTATGSQQNLRVKIIIPNSLVWAR